MHLNQDICIMYVLITAATQVEIQPTIDHLQATSYKVGEHRIGILITGVGSLVTSYELLTSIHQSRPGYIIQAGIAGSFSNDYGPGAVVLIKEEIPGDWGAQENGSFKDIFDLKLANQDEAPFTNKGLVNPDSKTWIRYNMPLVKSVTINEITTSAKRIEELKAKYDPAIESMEGAALHYICLREKIPFMQLRAVSNFVGERDKTKWKLKEAVTLLNQKLINIIPQLL